MTPYELILSFEDDVLVDDLSILPNEIKGFYADDGNERVILINKSVKTDKERRCIFIEELGHLKTSIGDITDQSKIANRKQERHARGWGYKRLIPLGSFIKAFKNGTRSKFELSEFLDVTEQFIEDSIKYYKEKFGLYCEMGNYIIYFEPLGVLEKFDIKDS